MAQQSDQPLRVLVTGSTGAIGQPVCRHLLAAGYRVRGLARRPTPGLDDFVQGDLTDRAAIDRAVEGVDVLLHLAAYPNPADFLTVLLEPNVIGLYHVCEAAVAAGVQRLVLSSSVQAVSGHRFDRPIRLEDGPAPTNHYALTKVWAEAAGEMYARRHGLSVITVRIGWLPRNPAEAARAGRHERGRAMYFSHADACRFYQCCVESPRPAPGEHALVFAASRWDNPYMDPTPAREILGYEPQDTYPEGLPFAPEASSGA